MVAILENPEICQLVGKISVQAYEQMSEDPDGICRELIRGVLIKKMAPSAPKRF